MYMYVLKANPTSTSMHHIHTIDRRQPAPIGPNADLIHPAIIALQMEKAKQTFPRSFPGIEYKINLSPQESRPQNNLGSFLTVAACPRVHPLTPTIPSG